MENLNLLLILGKGFALAAKVLAGGGLLWAFIAAAKKITPWLAGKTVVLRAAGMVLSALGVLAIKASTGQIEGADLQTFAQAVLEAAGAWVTAHTIHRMTKPEDENA